MSELIKFFSVLIPIVAFVAFICYLGYKHGRKMAEEDKKKK